MAQAEHDVGLIVQAVSEAKTEDVAYTNSDRSEVGVAGREIGCVWREVGHMCSNLNGMPPILVLIYIYHLPISGNCRSAVQLPCH